jgi:hypothetical protein
MNCLQCIQLTGLPCHWVEDDLCSVCADVSKKNGSTEFRGTVHRLDQHPKIWEEKKRINDFPQKTGG